MSYWNDDDESFGKDLHVGDLVFAVYNNLGEGTIYRIEKIETRGDVKLRPIFCLQDGQREFTRKPRVRTLDAGWVRKITQEHLVTVLSELNGYLKELRGQKTDE